ncbi:TIGR02206 family membrane protein [Alkalihalobacillus pseudalcaliphilus]|uniref:YwaF family protein n=1 Tax=Alkalihalobacillus pseudalcaliphilus TaxID=79884 RepID=UPI00069FBA5C|nr:TIGR02206 family membrane protein [Alkalihalobacillus pseudalcaliphilus]
MTWFSYEVDGFGFQLFGVSHLLVILTLFLIVAFIFSIRNRLEKNRKLERSIRFSLAIILLLLEVTYHIWLLVNGRWEITYALPLHLSSITLVTAIFMLFTLNKRLFEFTFFAGVGSAFLTIITPDIGGFGFPHFRFFHFFMAHGLVIIAVIYLLFIRKFTLSLRTVWSNWLILNGYAFFVFSVNWLVGGNYMYLMQKPPSPSPFDWFGPWPYYIIVLQVVALGLFFFMYGLYRIYDPYRKRSSCVRELED